MTATIRRLMLLTDVRRTRLALAALLGVLTILFGVGLMGTAGYLISRAAEHPAVLSLTAAIVGVRFFGLARPLARYLERLASHDVALRSLGRARAQVYEAVEPLAPAQLEDTRRGDLLSRFVGDVDSLQNLYLRGLEPPLVALIAGTASVVLAAFFLPAAALVLGIGLLVGGVAVPVAASSVSRRSSEGYARARGALSAELVETLAGSAELAAFGLERERIRAMRRADSRLVRISRRAALADGLGDGLRLLVTGATVVGVLAVARPGSRRGTARPRPDRGAGAPLAGRLRGRPAADRVVPRAADDGRGRPTSTRPDRPRAARRRPRAASPSTSCSVHDRARARPRPLLPRRAALHSTPSACASNRAAESSSSARAEPARRRSSACSSASSIRSAGA